MIKSALICLAVGFFALAALPAQQLPGPKKLTRIEAISAAALKSKPAGAAKVAIAPEEKTRITWLKSAKANIAASVKAGKLQAKDRETKENEADYTYFKSKYGNVHFDDFKAIKDLIISNGYSDISEVLATVALVDSSNINFSYVYYSSFLVVLDERIYVLNLSNFNKITRLTGLSRLGWLEYLGFHNSPIADGCFEALRNLRDLRTLHFINSNISDLRGIDNFKKLEQGIVNFGKISQYEKITVLDRLFSLSPKKLKRFFLTGNPLSVAPTTQFANFVRIHPEIVYK